MNIRLILFLTAFLVTAVAWSQVPQVPAPEFVKAQALESQGRLAEARDIYEALYRAAPNDLYFWKLIVVCERLGDFKSMERFALERLEARPGDAAVVNYLSRAYHGQGEEDKARKTLIDNIGSRWGDAARVRSAANEFQYRNDLDGAAEIYLTARSKLGDKKIFALELARIYAAQMNFAAAESEYLKVLEESPAAYPNIETLIKQSAGARVPLPDLARPLEEYLRANPKSIRAAKLLARIRFDLGDGRGAFQTVLAASVKAGTPQEAWAFAERLAGVDRPGDALFAYAEFQRAFPRDTNARSALLKAAGLRMEEGDREGARRDYSALIGEYPGTLEAQFAALRLIELSGDEGADVAGRLRAFADSTVDRAVAFEAMIMIGDKCLRRGDTQEAGRAFERALFTARSVKERRDALSCLARLHFYAGDYEAMTQDVESCVSIAPDGEDSNDLLALRVLVLRSATERDRRCLGAYARGRYALFRGLESEGADSLAAAAADTASAVSSAAASVLGDHWRDKGDAARALEWYERAIAAARDTTVRVDAIMDAAELEREVLRDPGAARKRYVEALTVYPGTVFEAELRNRLRSIAEK